MSRKKGIFGEYTAQSYLQSKGFKIVNRNYISRYGEIDIIASKDDCLVFVEVKFRKRKSLVSGMESVDIRKQNKITKTALVYLSEINENLNARFDVIEITAKEGEKYDVDSIIHIENAFSLNSFYLNAA